MSTLPPNLAGSILQSHLAQRQASKVRERDEAQRATAERKNSSAIDEKDTTVETTDSDTQIHTDAEGTGSQGRAFTQGEAPDEEQDREPPPPPVGDTGHHIDLEA